MKKHFKITLLVSILFLGLIRLRPIWERELEGLWTIAFFFFIMILFFLIIIKGINEIIRIIKFRKSLNLLSFLPIFILSIALFDGLYNPLGINLDRFYGNVIFRACYEGTQNQATFKLRDNGKFDIHSTGAFFSNSFFKGDFIKSGDTILMNFKTEAPRLFGDSLLVKDEGLFTIKGDSLISTRFYLGYCKGLN